MLSKSTNADLFERAIVIEDLQQEFYKILSEMFTHNREVADFWKKLEEDEMHHSNLLESIRGSLSPDRLQAKADPSVVSMVNEILEISAEERTNSISNLNDAYELAYDQENSEMNMIFKFLVKEFSRSDDVQKFALAEIENHIMKLWDFPRMFGDIEWRKSIKIRE
jgi:rubrerythrin